MNAEPPDIHSSQTSRTRGAIKIAPSLLSSDFARLGEVVAGADQAKADYLHFDVMDGRFVPNITLGPPIIAAARPHSSLFFDVHLMIESPERYFEAFAKAGATGVTIQVEAVTHLFRAIDQIHKLGMKAGVALCPGTPFSHIEEVAVVADLLLVMTVDPGFGGQRFIPSMLEKVRRAARLRERLNRWFEIEVDGGIDAETAPVAVEAGASVLVAGSALFGANCPLHDAIQQLRAAAESAKHSPPDSAGVS